MVSGSGTHRTTYWGPGGLASIVGKELLNGQKVVVVPCEEISISGGLLNRMNTKPSHGPSTFALQSKSSGTSADGWVILDAIKVLRLQSGQKPTSIASLLGNKPSLRVACPKCKQQFCLDCDIYIHESLHNCPGCESTRHSKIPTANEGG